MITDYEGIDLSDCLSGPVLDEVGWDLYGIAYSGEMITCIM